MMQVLKQIVQTIMRQKTLVTSSVHCHGTKHSQLLIICSRVLQLTCTRRLTTTLTKKYGISAFIVERQQVQLFKLYTKVSSGLNSLAVTLSIITKDITGHMIKYQTSKLNLEQYMKLMAELTRRNKQMTIICLFFTRQTKTETAMTSMLKTGSQSIVQLMKPYLQLMRPQQVQVLLMSPNSLILILLKVYSIKLTYIRITYIRITYIRITYTRTYLS